VSQNQLGRLTAMDPATIQGVIQRLLVRGLVERYPDASDRRCTLLRLSPAGKQLATSVIGPARAISEQTLSPLGESERATFLDLLRKLL
jgi:DNA-binding MarR family transcriptional regulator